MSDVSAATAHAIPERRPTDTSCLTLDPPEWSGFRHLAHRAVDDMVDFISNSRVRAAWQPLPREIGAEIAEALPEKGQPPEAVYADFLHRVLPYSLGNTHPRFWGWVTGSGAPMGVLADMLAAAVNANVAGWDQSAVAVEQQVLRWWSQLLGLPEDATGILVGGGSQANLVGLAVARTARSGIDVRADGVGALRVAFYCSAETHSSVLKAVELLGHGRSALRYVPCDAACRMDVDALAESIRTDREQGVTPICVVGNAGTVNTGAIDDLTAIADVCRRERLWFHVDGAFGAAAVMSKRLRPLLAGIERADSIALDMHKWLYLPYDVGCVLVRDPNAHRATFSAQPAYLAPAGRGIAPQELPFAQLGIDLSRSFRALKVWMAMKAYGVEGYAQLIEQNCKQAQYLQERVQSIDELELLSRTPLNVVCFRYRGRTDRRDLDAVNGEILVQIQEQGIAVPSSTRINGAFALRVAIVNHRSTYADFDALVDAVLRIGRAL